jgi:transposase
MIPGIGPVTASAIVATAGNATQFKSGRDLRPGSIERRQGRLGRISEDRRPRYLRRLLVSGMIARLIQMKRDPERSDPWVEALLARKPARLATGARANKTARIIWAMLTKNEPYRSRTV